MNVNAIEILVVEDRQDDVVLLKRAFRDARLRNHVEVVDTGRAALDYLFRRSARGAARPKPGLVILDLGLPDMSGLEVLREIRGDEELAEVPVIVLTISDEDEDIIRSYDLGVQAFIQKPVRVHNLQDYFLGDESSWFVITRTPA